MTKKTRAKARRALLTLSLVLVVAFVAVGGTIAWLTDTTTEVKNTFTPADIDIDLIETKKPDGTVVSAGVTDWSAEMIPGKEYSKNPVVSVNRDRTDVDVFLFVEFNPGDSATYLDYEMNWDGWTELTGVSTTTKPVYYRVVGKDDTTISWNLIKDDKVTVKSTLLKKDATEDGTKMPTSDVEMSFKAYAIQTEGFIASGSAGTVTEATAAWNAITK